MKINRETVRYWRATFLSLTSKLARAEAESEPDLALRLLIEEGLTDKPRAGAPATFTAEQICQIVAVGCENPAESNRSISHWTPRELADEVIKRKIVESISVRSVGRFYNQADLKPHKVEQWLNLHSIETDKQFRERFKGTPLLRPKRRGLLRNAAIVARNIGCAAAVPALIERITRDPEPLIRSHALWALAHLDPGKAIPFIEQSLSDPDSQIREEAIMCAGSSS